MADASKFCYRSNMGGIVGTYFRPILNGFAIYIFIVQAAQLQVLLSQAPWLHSIFCADDDGSREGASSMFFQMTKIESSRTIIFLNITRQIPTLSPTRLGPLEGRLRPPPHVIVWFP